MAYIGRGTENISNVEVLDNLTFNGSASYTLQKSSVNFVPSSANNLLISISGVVQQGNFTVSGSTITFDTTVASSDTCDWILHYGTGLITTVADGAITEAKLGSGAVTNAKLSNSSVTVNGTAIALGASGTITAGKIGQMISATHSTQFQTSSSTRAATGLTATITPSASSSKILVLMTMAVSINRTNAEQYLQFALQRNGSDIWDTVSTQPWGVYMGGTNHVHLKGQINLNYVDSPSTTSATTYSITGAAHGGGTASFNALNIPSMIQLLEVLA